MADKKKDSKKATNLFEKIIKASVDDKKDKNFEKEKDKK